MVLVAMAMVAIIAIAALSIDVITLYLAREEAQRSADAAALAAARVISMSGITGTADPDTDASSWTKICGGIASVASVTAQAVAQQNAVGGTIGTVTVKYSVGTVTPVSDCSSLATGFAVNPLVTVQVSRASLPTFFSRMWGHTGSTVSATAIAEAFNPSDSADISGGSMIPVQPRCVKPWVVPNRDPWNPGKNVGGYYCDQSGGPGPCQPLVARTDGSIQNPGISLGGTNATGVIGERFWLAPDCTYGGTSCTLRETPAQGNVSGANLEPVPNLDYLPGLVGTTVTAIPSCTSGAAYEQAIEGCDESTNYQCGVPVATTVDTIDLSENPAFSGDTSNGVKCLIHQGDVTDITGATGQDYLNPYGQPSSYPFQILAGSSNPIAILAGNPVSNSSSIVSLPIYDGNGTAGYGNNGTVNATGTTTVTFVGFLQVFINAVDPYGNIDVTVLNVTGCGNGTSPTGNPVTGSSPVPVRLVTPP